MSQETGIVLKEMSQLYARVFVQILDSSIADDFTVRHVFEDFLKLSNHRTGIVDMTRQALSRRLNVPLDILNPAIDKLEAPDPNSRDDEYEGRRIERLDVHRDWGWKILNWEKYEAIRNRADSYMRVSKHREKERDSSKGFQKPSLEEIKLHFSKAGLPMAEAEKFYDYYTSNGWKVGKNPMRSWTSAAANWKKNYEEHRTHSNKSNGADTVVLGKEYDRVIQRMQTIKNTYGDHQSWNETDKTEFATLKTRRGELRATLGITV